MVSFVRIKNLSIIIFYLFSVMSIGLPGIAQHQTPLSDPAIQQQRAETVARFWTAERMSMAIPERREENGTVPSHLTREDPNAKPPFFASTPAPQISGITTSSAVSEMTAPPPLSIAPIQPAAAAVVHQYTPFRVRIGGQSSPLSFVYFYFVINGKQSGAHGQYLGNQTWEVRLPSEDIGTGFWTALARDVDSNWASMEVLPITVEMAPWSGIDSSMTPIGLEPWDGGGPVQTATGTLFFELPEDAARTSWAKRRCMGTVVTDDAPGRSIILTSAHCIYSDTAKAFARNVLFVPNHPISGDGLPNDACTAAPYGCWAPSFGVVQNAFATERFPRNTYIDYGFYIAEDQGAHIGPKILNTERMEAYTGSLPLSFGPDIPTGGPSAVAFGMNDAATPSLSRCSEWVGFHQNESRWPSGTRMGWLSECALPAEALGGPWIKPFNEHSGAGPIISVNSWIAGGMFGPHLNQRAECLFDTARSTAFNAVLSQDGEAGLVVTECQ